jgi:hypothetical protein
MNDDILPGVTLTVEEVEPGVFRVVDDGVRDLAKANDLDIVAGHDGGIWLLRPQRFVRLGDDEWHAWPTGKPEVTDFEVAPDGTVWTVLGSEDDSSIQSFDGEGWTAHHEAWCPLVEVTPDGTVWAMWDVPESDRMAFGYLGDDGWQQVGEGHGRALLVSGTGDIWETRGGPSCTGFGWPVPRTLHRFIDGEWQPHGETGPVDVAPDGTVWTLSSIWTQSPGVSVRYFDGNEWQGWSSLAGSQFAGLRPAVLALAPDRSVWVGHFVAVTDDEAVCGGVGNFDGAVWSGYLPDVCVEALEIAADGSVWLLATESGAHLRHLYVITPEAMAATD